MSHLIVVELFKKKIESIESIEKEIMGIYELPAKKGATMECTGSPLPDATDHSSIALIFSDYLHATIVPPEIMTLLSLLADHTTELERAKMELRDSTYATAIELLPNLPDKTRVGTLIFEYPKNNYVHKIHSLISDTTAKTLDLYKLADKDANFMKGFIADKLIIEIKIKISNTIFNILEGIRNDMHHIELTMKLINNELEEIGPGNNKRNSRMYS